MNKNQVSIEAEKSLQKIQKLDDANQKIAFYAERGSDWNHYSKIINELIIHHMIPTPFVVTTHEHNEEDCEYEMRLLNSIFFL